MQRRSGVFGNAVLCAGLTVIFGGCTAEEASEVVDQVEESAAETAELVKDETEEAVAKTKELASELGEKASAYLNPLKEKFGNLEDVKDKPEELKKAVSSLITSIEERAEDVELPERLNQFLAAAKEKLVALKEYLEGEVEQAKVDEHVQEIMATLKTHLGMSNDQ